MKKLLTFYIALMLSAFSAYAFTVELPDEKTLTSRISMVMSSQFIERTTLAKDLAGRTVQPLGVNIAVECAMHDYLKGLPLAVKITATMNKPLLVRAILEDHPAAIAQLVAMGLLE
jgi:hypothetical protein